jgi:hypothetical protein
MLSHALVPVADGDMTQAVVTSALPAAQSDNMGTAMTPDVRITCSGIDSKTKDNWNNMDIGAWFAVMYVIFLSHTRGLYLTVI